ncbi:hypothetical protein [Solibacillus cecembensis]|uniref:hypothetical protein n=1 Tax=Solibacillus cecembensis TaxID=459347 RepID=UPI003D084199
MEFNIFYVLILFIFIYLLSTVIKLSSRVKGLEYKLEQISKQFDVPESPINNELRQLLKEGNDVKAVKKVRETLGLSLVEAKQYIDVLKLEVK